MTASPQPADERIRTAITRVLIKGGFAVFACSDDYYVQVLRRADGTLIGEAVGNKNLRAPLRLTGEQEDKLTKMGWLPPDPESSNFHRRWADASSLDPSVPSQVLGQTLHDVYGWKDPGPLRISTDEESRADGNRGDRNQTQRAWVNGWGASTIVGVALALITQVQSERGRRLIEQYWWLLLGLVLWVITYEALERLHAWHLIADEQHAISLARWQKLGLSGFLSVAGSWSFYQWLRQPNKEDWLEAGVLALIALVAFRKRFERRYGWIGLGALIYLVFFAFRAELITGDEWNFWRFLVFAAALFVAGLFGPIASGDASIAVLIGCWAIAFGLWQLRNWLIDLRPTPRTNPP